MAKKTDKEFYWKGFSDKDFINEHNIHDDDIATFNKNNMTIYAANVNYDRQMPKVFDSLKPVERKIMLVMYYDKLYPNARSAKSQQILGNVQTIHPHGEAYGSMANMAKPWKFQVPLVEGKGNFGTIQRANSESAPRYTEARLSKYAMECFFEDYDESCILVNHNLQIGSKYIVPTALPSKFPNILVNGGMGIAFANAYAIPPFNIDDIIKNTKKLLKDPNTKHIYMYPDIPSGCEIVNDGRNLNEICETGKGTFKMRATIDIIDTGKTWTLKVSSLPWLISLDDVHAKIVELVRAKAVDIKDIIDASEAYKVNGMTMTDLDFRIIISKACDPYQIRNYLYKNTNLEKTLSVIMNVVTEEGLSIKRCNLRTLILEWINERREYKRRLLNRKVQKLKERITLLEILIELLSADNLNKTIKIIRNSNSNEAESRLVKDYGMNSNQAKHIIAMPLSAFTADSRDKYKAELSKKKEELDYVMEMIISPKKIDEIIAEEIDCLKKYSSPRKSKIVDAESGTYIADTMHRVVISKRGIIKKLPAEVTGSGRGIGAFPQGDYPVQEVTLSNLDTVILFDSMGKYSNIPVASIQSCDYNNMSNKVFDVSRLDGEIIYLCPFINKTSEEIIQEFTKKKLSIGFLTEQGYFKKCDISEFISSSKQVRGSRAMKIKDNDKVTFVNVVDDDSDIFIYTKKGNFTCLKARDIHNMSKDAIGNKVVKLNDGDTCVGYFIMPKKVQEIVVVTAKGCMKRIEFDYVDNTRRKMTSYIATVRDGDEIVKCFAVPTNGKYYIEVNSRLAIAEVPLDDIRVMARKSIPAKQIPIPNGDNIISVNMKRVK